jgi:hypothetical protein
MDRHEDTGHIARLQHLVGLLISIGELVLVVILIQIARHFQAILAWTGTAK